MPRAGPVTAAGAGLSRPSFGRARARRLGYRATAAVKSADTAT